MSRNTSRQRNADGTGMRRARRRGLSDFRIKVIATTLLAVGTLGTTMIPALAGTGGSGAALRSDASQMTMTGLTLTVLSESLLWAATPLYSWLLVQGLRHTRNLGRYMASLLVLALLAEVPYDLTTTGTSVDWSSQNPTFALLVSLVVLAAIRWARSLPASQGRLMQVLVAAAGFAWMLICRVGVRQQFINLGVLTLACCLIFYLCRTETVMMFGAGLLGALFGVTPAFGVVALHWRNEELGYDRKHSWVKWVFYVSYPLILSVCALTVM